jgi:hypothetical protein
MHSWIEKGTSTTFDVDNAIISRTFIECFEQIASQPNPLEVFQVKFA